MSEKYSIDQTTKTLVFTSFPQKLERSSVDWADRDSFSALVIPNSVSTVGNRAFWGCSSLSSVHIPNSVTNLGYSAFFDCTALSSIHISNAILTIGHGAFYNCSSLSSVHIPNSVAAVRHEVFQNCASLAAIHIPNSVSTIGGSGFCYCSRLHTVCLSPNSRIVEHYRHPSFPSQTVILRPRLKPLLSLQKKSACHGGKTSYSIYL